MRSWNKRATYLMVDQPAGVGLSSVDGADCYAQTEDQAMEQFHAALVAFLRAYPQYAELDLFLFGESYAGNNPSIPYKILGFVFLGF